MDAIRDETVSQEDTIEKILGAVARGVEVKVISPAHDGWLNVFTSKVDEFVLEIWRNTFWYPHFEVTSLTIAELAVRVNSPSVP